MIRVKPGPALTVLVACSFVGAVASASEVRAVMGGVRQTRYSKEGAAEVVIGSERASMDDEGMLDLRDVEAAYVDEAGEVRISAERGYVDTSGVADAVFEGRLELRFSDHLATTSRALRRASDGSVWGEDEIVLTSGGSRIVGSGFEVHPVCSNHEETETYRTVIYRPRGVVRFQDFSSDDGSEEDRERLESVASKRASGELR